MKDWNLTPGQKIKFNNLEWKILQHKRGIVFVENPSFPVQRINYLMLCQWLDSGRATII